MPEFIVANILDQTLEAEQAHLFQRGVEDFADVVLSLPLQQLTHALASKFPGLTLNSTWRADPAANTRP